KRRGSRTRSIPFSKIASCSAVKGEVTAAIVCGGAPPHPARSASEASKRDFIVRCCIGDGYLEGALRRVNSRRGPGALLRERQRPLVRAPVAAEALPELHQIGRERRGELRRRPGARVRDGQLVGVQRLARVAEPSL